MLLLLLVHIAQVLSVNGESEIGLGVRTYFSLPGWAELTTRPLV